MRVLGSLGGDSDNKNYQVPVRLLILDTKEDVTGMRHHLFPSIKLWFSVPAVLPSCKAFKKYRCLFSTLGTSESVPGICTYKTSTRLGIR